MWRPAILVFSLLLVANDTWELCFNVLGKKTKRRYNNTYPPKIQKCEKGKPEREVESRGVRERAGGSDERATVRRKTSERQAG